MFTFENCKQTAENVNKKGKQTFENHEFKVAILAKKSWIFNVLAWKLKK